MYKKGYVRGNKIKEFLSYLLEQKYINTHEMYMLNADVMRETGLGDAMFFKVHSDKPWKIDYLKTVGKKFKVSVVLYGDISDKRTHKKIV